jgi:type II secretory pathway pseudopilin PulG
MIELLLVIAMIGAVAAIAVPRMRTFRDSSAVRSARLELTAAIEAARAASIQRGRAARVRIRNDSVLVTVDTSAVGSATTLRYTVLGPKSLRAEHGVSITGVLPSDTGVAFESRGLASPRLDQTAIFVIRRGAMRDSVCVSRLGMLLPSGCTP